MSFQSIDSFEVSESQALNFTHTLRDYAFFALDGHFLDLIMCDDDYVIITGFSEELNSITHNQIRSYSDCENVKYLRISSYYEYQVKHYVQEYTRNMINSWFD